MAGVNNPQNFKPLFDMQGQAIVDEIQNSQSAINFTVSTSGDAVLSAISNLSTANVNRINGARDALYGYMSNYRNLTREQIEAFELATGQALTGLAAEVEALKAEVQTVPKSPIKSIQRGSSFVSGNAVVKNISVSQVDISKVILNANGCYNNSIYVVDSETIATRSQNNNSSLISWELIEYA